MAGAGVVAVTLLVVSMMTALGDDKDNDNIQKDDFVGCDYGKYYLDIRNVTMIMTSLMMVRLYSRGG
jgi:hypothetical protein